jgi:signal transduction histidine kinase
MTRRDRLVVAVVLALMAGVAALIVVSVIDADHRGVRALERQRLESINQLGRSMDAQVQAAVTGFSGIVARPFNLTPNDPDDVKLLQSFVTPSSRTGFFLTDASGRITAGVLLRDESAVGTRPTIAGLDAVLSDGGAKILAVQAHGLTTSLPVLDVAAAITDATGSIRGAFVVETEASADSTFNLQVAPLGGSSTGQFFVLDENGAVVASSQAEAIGKPVDDQTLVTLPEGLHRRHGLVEVVADIPSAGWRAVFRQNSEDFEGGLSRRLATVTVLVVLAGAVGAAVSMVTITRRLRNSREEQRRLRELNQAREEFISIVSHELRTPVAGVLGFLETTVDHWGVMDDDQRHQAVVRATGNARRLQMLARDVLDTASIDEGRLRYVFGPLDLRAEVSTAVEGMRDFQPERAIDLATPTGPVMVNADGDRILQVLMNLFENAVNSSPLGTPIAIAVGVDGGDATVAVTDRGPGLTAAEREEVFAKFARGSRSGVRGTGLGLYVSREIIRAHGGRIWSETAAEGGGATFVFTIPLAAAVSPAASAVSATPA